MEIKTSSAGRINLRIQVHLHVENAGNSFKSAGRLTQSRRATLHDHWHIDNFVDVLQHLWVPVSFHTKRGALDELNLRNLKNLHGSLHAAKPPPPTTPATRSSAITKISPKWRVQLQRPSQNIHVSLGVTETGAAEGEPVGGLVDVATVT